MMLRISAAINTTYYNWVRSYVLEPVGESTPMAAHDPALSPFLVNAQGFVRDLTRSR